MRARNWTVGLIAAASLAACSRGKTATADDALKSDLALAAQTTTPTPNISPAEATPAATAPQLVHSSASRSTYHAPVRHSAPVHHSSSRSTASNVDAGSGGGYYPAVPAPPPPPPPPVKHTRRDAAIGAAAGAVLGGVAGHSVKGGVIGAVLGGVLGGVVGNNVDIDRRGPLPQD